jgi:hypothetical protein
MACFATFLHITVDGFELIRDRIEGFLSKAIKGSIFLVENIWGLALDIKFLC